ncbi:MAG: tetratricopeptide repeat protein [Planctomycetota bacterium]|nr:tetratricopeptide repeat protein [Planctomycetota bacterium]
MPNADLKKKTKKAIVLARHCLERGMLADAQSLCREILNLQPDQSDALRIMGIVAFREDRLVEAVEFLRQSVATEGKDAEAYHALGDALRDLGNGPESRAAYDMTIVLRPDFPQVYNSLGNLFWNEGKLQDAIVHYSKAAKLKPGYPDANWSMGKVLVLLGRLPDAVNCFREVLQFNPTNAKAHFNFARILARAGRREEAAAEYRQAIAMRPDYPDWQFELAAFVGDNSVTTIPPAYIRRLFDGYAPTFDKHLVEDLAYRVPELLLRVVLAVTSRRDLDVLDLGCGTGLCGIQFRPHARYLTGVDLAPEMLKAAAQRRIYDELIKGDLLPFLRAQPDQYDVILAGDVLIYIGDLAELMPAVAESLHRGGWFAFSIEDYDGPGFFLHAEERFAHSLTYIREQAAKAGLEERAVLKTTLRKHGGSDTPGSIILLEKSANHVQEKAL